MQSENIRSVLFNVDPKRVSELQTTFGDKSFKKLKPIFVIDKFFNISIIGIEKSELELIKESDLLKVNKEKAKTLTEKYENYLMFESEQILYNLSQKKVFSFIESSIVKRIKKIILNDENKIYHPNAKVLLPNKYYCHGFFEIYRILEVESISQDISLYLSMQLLNERIAAIITLGENCKNLLDNKFSKNILKIHIEEIKRYHISTESVFPQAFKISNEIDDDKNIVIMTDVIGSSDTLKNVLHVLRKKKISKVITIINTNENIKEYIDVDQRSYQLTSIVDNPLVTFKSVGMGFFCGFLITQNKIWFKATG